MSRLLSHRDDISSSSLLRPRFFLPSRRLLFSLPLVSHCCFQIATLVSLVSGRNRFFYSTDSSIIPPRHFTMVQRPSDASSPPLPSPRARRVNFLQIGILLQFASSSIILAPPRSPPPHPRPRLKLLFIPPLSIPRSSPRTLLT